MKNGKTLAALLLALTVSFGLCACGGQSDSTSGAKTDIKAETGAENLSDTLVYAGENESTINPVLSSHDEIVELVFSGLMKYDGNGIAVPDLAESCEYDEATCTYTFHLKNGVKWHDGEAFTAKDVVFTYQVLTEDETLTSSVTSNYEDITDITAPDDETVVITLDKYCANMPGYFTIGIIPQHLLEGEDMNTTSFNQHPVGTGRFKFVDWDMTGGLITVVRNEDYYWKVTKI